MTKLIRHESTIYTPEEWVNFLVLCGPTKIEQSTLHGQKRPSWAVWFDDENYGLSGYTVTAAQAKQIAELTGLELRRA
jgi:hypothetical protein